MSTRKQKKFKGKKSRRTPKNAQGGMGLLVNRSLNFMPARYRTTLSFQVDSIIVNVGNTAANKRYRPTYAYDIDFAGASTAAPGFTELGVLYRVYRVNAFSYKASFSNLEAFPGTVYVCPTNVDLGANASLFQDMLSNRRSRLSAVGPLTGNGIKTISGRVTQADFAGLPISYSEDTTTGTTAGTIPANNIFLSLGFVSSGAVQVSGCFYSLKITFEIDFFELANPTT